MVHVNKPQISMTHLKFAINTRIVYGLKILTFIYLLQFGIEGRISKEIHLYVLIEILPG